MATIEVSSIKVYDGSAWRELRGGKVFDGTTWRTIDTGFQVYDGNGNWIKLKSLSANFVAVGGNDTILTSADGTTWSSV